MTLFVAGLVVALFFALLTLERIGLYSVLKAIGARRARWPPGVLQAVIVAARLVRHRAACVSGSPRPPRRIPVAVVPAPCQCSVWSSCPPWGSGLAAPCRPCRPASATAAHRRNRSAALELTVRKTYASGDAEIVALDHATLEVGDDEILALVGPSGSGKTTLLSISGGLLTPSEGKVVVGGQDISTTRPSSSPLPPRLGRLRVPGRQPGAVPHGRENLMIVNDFGSTGRTRTPAGADKLLDELGLSTGSTTCRARCRVASASASPSAGR